MIRVSHYPDTKDVVLEDKKKVLLKDIKWENQLGKQEEPIVTAIKELWQFVVKLLYSIKWSKSEYPLLFCSKIYISNTTDLCRRVVILYYNSEVTRYLDRWKILELVSQNY